MITVTSVWGIQKALGQSENPAYPPPSPCVSCQSNNWYKLPVSYDYTCPDASICKIWIDVFIPLGCGQCEIWLGDITEPTDCSCYVNLDWTTIMKGAVSAALSYFQQSGLCSGQSLHVFTSECRAQTEPFTVPPVLPGGHIYLYFSLSLW